MLPSFISAVISAHKSTPVRPTRIVPWGERRRNPVRQWFAGWRENCSWPRRRDRNISGAVACSRHLGNDHHRRRILGWPIHY